MSGLEPIAALSLACNILQVIGVGRETVRIAKQVYQDGALDPALTRHADVLDGLANQIHTMTAAAPTAKPKAQDQRLLDLAHKCQRAASSLTEEVKFLNGPLTQAKLIATLKIAAKTTWRKRRLDRLDKDLKDAENLLQTGLLTAIYQHSLATTGALVSFGLDLRAFIDEYRAGKTSTTDLVKNCIATESKRNEEAVKSHVTRTTNKTEAALRTHIDIAFRGVADREQDAEMDSRRERLLRSLKFDRMNERRSTVSPAHSNTLDWMFQDGSDVDGSQRTDSGSDPLSWERETESESWNSRNTVTWDSFSDWLRSTDTTYWISGKPGSGKTTLMKYIVGHKQTKAYLDEWAPDAVLVSHFFWRPGNKMQQSIRGLLCSLLHQLFSGSPQAISMVIQSNAAILTKDSETDWSEEELQSVFHHVMSCYPRPIALFLDGLDEVLPKDGVLRLLALVDRLKELYAHTGKVKMCLGSRREPLLLRKLGFYPQLRLHQLNREDLQQYCRAHVVIPLEYHIRMPTTLKLSHELESYSRERPPNRDNLEAWLIDTLVHKAEGVFLWVCLTTTTIMSAIYEGDSIEDLKRRIDSLPEDLADLYSDMWTRVNQDKHQKVRAASYLQLALGDTVVLHPFKMMVATTPRMMDMFFAPGTSTQISAERLVEACKETMRETIVRCAGLLTLFEPPKPLFHPVDSYIPWHDEEYRRLLPYIGAGAQYSFIHRTARDFLTDTENGQQILSWGSYSGDSARLKGFEADLAVCKIFNRPAWIYNYRRPGVPRRFLRPSQDPYSTHFSRLYSEDEHTQAGVARLLLLVEDLSSRGYTQGIRVAIPYMASHFEEVWLPQAREPIYVTYGNPTVNGQHEFLLEAASNTSIHASIWKHILALSQLRNMDRFAIQKLLVQACHFEDLALPESEIRLECIQTLLSWGASPCDKVLSRNTFSPSTSSDLRIMSLESPFKALMQSIWSFISVGEAVSERFARKLFRIIHLCITQGANLREEVHIPAAFLPSGKMRFGRLSMSADYRPIRIIIRKQSSVAFIVAYPVSSILAKLLQLGKLTNLPQDDWLLDITEKRFAQGCPIAVTRQDLKTDQCREPLILNCLDMLQTEDTHPLGGETGVQEAFLRILRVAEGEFQGADPEVSIPSEYEADAVSAFERLKSSNVPVTERRREVRMRLGIETELEGPDWQRDVPIV